VPKKYGSLLKGNRTIWFVCILDSAGITSRQYFTSFLCQSHSFTQKVLSRIHSITIRSEKNKKKTVRDSLTISHPCHRPVSYGRWHRIYYRQSTTAYYRMEDFCKSKNGESSLIFSFFLIIPKNDVTCFYHLTKSEHDFGIHNILHGRKAHSSNKYSEIYQEFLTFQEKRERELIFLFTGRWQRSIIHASLHSCVWTVAERNFHFFVSIGGEIWFGFTKISPFP